jgi:hypothetical protein
MAPFLKGESDAYPCTALWENSGCISNPEKLFLVSHLVSNLVCLIGTANLE